VVENYVHRVGRTGRGMNRGTAVSFCSSEELPLIREIEKFTGNKINVTQVGKAGYQETLNLTEEKPGSLTDLFDEFEQGKKSKKKKNRDKWSK
jgi:ATP-dependent RNA helicase RhlE